MPNFRILKSGETDIDSTEIWRFALHSGYKCYKIASTGNVSITMTAHTSTANGYITHNLGYIPVFFAYIEYGSKGYLVSGSLNNPQIEVPGDGGFGNTIITFDVYADTTKLSIDAYANSLLGDPQSNETFTVRAFFIADEII